MALGAASVPPAAVAETAPGQVLRNYLHARMQGDLKAAQALWEPRDLRLSTALGIRFTDVEASYDDYWMQSAKARKTLAAQVRAAVQDSVVGDSWVRYTVVLEPQGHGAPKDTLSYVVKNEEGAWHVSLPFSELTNDWTRREGRFVRVRAKRVIDFSQHALTTVDGEIARIFEEIGAPQTAVLRLERIKLDYFLCDNENDVRALVGSLAHEGYLPAAGRVVSRSFVNMADVVPLLVQLTARQISLQNEPFFAEGLPLALGGTATASAAVVLQRARNANLDGKNLARCFQEGTARDEALPLEAIWNRILLDQLGAEAFLDLVKNSGVARSRQEGNDNARVLAAIEESVGKKGDALLRWAAEHVRDIPLTMQPGWKTWPPETYGLQSFLRWRDSEEKWGLQGFEIEDRYVITVGPHMPGPPQWMRDRVDSLALEFTGEKPAWADTIPPVVVRPVGDPPPSYLLVRAKLEEDLEPYESSLFAKQFISRDYRNDLWGFMITIDDVRLYDYTQNKIIAEYSVETAPPAALPYYDEEKGRICFSLSMSYFPRPLTAYYVFLGYYTGE